MLAALLTVGVFRGQDVAETLCRQPGSVADQSAFTRRVLCGQAPDSAQPLIGPARLLFGQKLDLNCASPRALEVVSGIGPVRAESIRAARCEAPFVSLEDAGRARGVGPATLAQLAAVCEVVHPSKRPISCDPGCL